MTNGLHPLTQEYELYLDTSRSRHPLLPLHWKFQSRYNSLSEVRAVFEKSEEQFKWGLKEERAEKDGSIIYTFESTESNPWRPRKPFVHFKIKPVIRLEQLSDKELLDETFNRR